MSDYLDKIQTQKKDGTPLATVPFRDSEAREDITTIQNELTTDTTTIEGNPLNFTTLSAQTAKSTILSLEPIQDLHGYDKPWVGGAGKNKLPMTVDGIKSANSNGTWSGNVYNYNGVDWTILTDSDNNVIGIKANGSANPESQLYIARNFTLSAEMTVNGSYQTSCMCECKVGSTYYSDIGSYPHNPPSGTAEYLRCLVRNNTSASNYVLYPMLRLSTESDATFQPYTNECGISGRTEIGILGLGRNQCNVLCGDFSHGGITFTNNGNGTFELHGTSTTAVDFRINQLTRTGKDHLTTYFVNNVYTCQTYTDKFKVRIMQDQTWASVFDTGYSANPVTQTISETKDNCFILVTIPTGKTFDHETFKIMLELGSDASSWEKSQDLTISLGQTVYGGTLDVENGVLVVDRKTITLNGTESTWESVGGSYPQTYRLTSNTAIDGDASQDKFFVNFTNKYPKLTENNPQYGMRFRNSHPEELLVYDARFQNDSTNFLAELSTNNLQFCYYLATPITINLTPHTINLLKGVNNISCTGDKITLTYRDGKVATLGDLTSAVDELDGKIDESKILTDTATGDKYILVVSNGVLSVEQVSD